MRRSARVIVAVLVAALAVSACKGPRKLTIYNLAPDAGSAPGYRGGTPITLADGSYVTQPNGTKVTSPTIPSDKRSETTVTTSNDGSQPMPGTTTSSTYLLTTGTTSREPVPTDKLAFPAPGNYEFHQTITRDDGSRGSDGDTYFRLSAPAPDTVNVVEANADGSPRNGGGYQERYDADGLWLVGSSLTGGVCAWGPKSASLPRKVIDGGSVVTKSECDASGTTLRLTTKVTFKVVRDVTIAGRTLRCIDVTRHRVLDDGESTITSDAVDTFSFDLGMRVATSEHTTTETTGGATGYTRNLVLVSLPS